MSEKNTHKKTSGFTLIELLIGIAIVGILAAVALPSYFETVQKNRRTDAIETLMRLAVLQEQYFSQYEEYASDIATLNGGSDKSSQGYYELSASAAIKTSFTLTAKAINGQEKDTQCKFFVIDSTNKRTSGTLTDDNSGNCW